MFKRWFYLFEDVEAIRDQFYKWAKGVHPDWTDQQINQLINQLAQEELQAGATDTDVWAKKRFRELLGTQRKKQIKEDILIRLAKGKDKDYYEWIIKLVNPTNREIKPAQMPSIRQQISGIDAGLFDYFKGANINPLNPFLDYVTAKIKSDQWHQEKYHKEQEATYKTPVTAGEQIDDMWMVKLNKEDERAEGIKMQHCVGDICKISPDNRIFSLRDKNNNPHVTIQVQDNSIEQIKGKQNASPILKYSDYVVKWILKHPEFELATLDDMPLTRAGLEALEDRMPKERILILAAESGYIDYIKKHVGWFGSLWWHDRALYAAAANGHMDIVKLMLEKGATDKDAAMGQAAANGHMDIVKLLLDKGATDYDEAMGYAAMTGNIDIVKLMLEKGATGYDKAMKYAADHGHIDIVKLMLEKGATDYNWTLIAAAREGNIDIVKLMLEKGATDKDEALTTAARNGHIDIVKLMLEKGVKHYNSAILDAYGSGHMDIIELIRSYMQKSA